MHCQPSTFIYMDAVYIRSTFLTCIHTMHSNSWFFGSVKRDEAEKLLKAHPKCGTFLVRESESKPGDYSLSIFNEGAVKHYRICCVDEKGFFIESRAIFSTLKELVHHYTQNSDLNLCHACPQPASLQIDPSHKDMEIPCVCGVNFFPC